MRVSRTRDMMKKQAECTDQVWSELHNPISDCGEYIADDGIRMHTWLSCYVRTQLDLQNMPMRTHGQVKEQPLCVVLGVEVEHKPLPCVCKG